MDSACTFHICPNKEWFSSLDLINGRVILMGNDVACKMKGIGKIRLKLHDGSTRVLEEVQYVVVMKATRQNNLYNLQMTTIVGAGCHNF